MLSIAATLGATSVCTTARVLAELNAVRPRQAKSISGAAIFDDVLGLVALATAEILALARFFVVASLRAGFVPSEPPGGPAAQPAAPASDEKTAATGR